MGATSVSRALWDCRALNLVFFHLRYESVSFWLYYSIKQQNTLHPTPHRQGKAHDLQVQSSEKELYLFLDDLGGSGGEGAFWTYRSETLGFLAPVGKASPCFTIRSFLKLLPSCKSIFTVWSDSNSLCPKDAPVSIT